jgi:hypothetical protein
MISREAFKVLTKSKGKFGFPGSFETVQKAFQLLRSVTLEVVIIASSMGHLD